MTMTAKAHTVRLQYESKTVEELQDEKAELEAAVEADKQIGILALIFGFLFTYVSFVTKDVILAMPNGSQELKMLFGILMYPFAGILTMAYFFLSYFPKFRSQVLRIKIIDHLIEKKKGEQKKVEEKN
jgi:type IV secretory pathway TrbL component